MDTARELLNNLMGRDRNKPKGDMSGRDHYSNRDVDYENICRYASLISYVFVSTPCSPILSTKMDPAIKDMTRT